MWDESRSFSLTWGLGAISVQNTKYANLSCEIEAAKMGFSDKYSMSEVHTNQGLRWDHIHKLLQ